MISVLKKNSADLFKSDREISPILASSTVYGACIPEINNILDGLKPGRRAGSGVG